VKAFLVPPCTCTAATTVACLYGNVISVNEGHVYNVMFEKDVRKLSLKSRFIPDNDTGMKIVVSCNLHPCTEICVATRYLLLEDSADIRCVCSGVR